MKRQGASKIQLQQNNHGSKDPPQQKPPETMASWFERQVSSHQVQLAAVALFSGVAVAGTIYGTQAVRREKRVEELKASIPELSESHHADMVRYLLLHSYGFGCVFLLF